MVGKKKPYLQNNPADANLVPHVKQSHSPIHSPILVVKRRLLWPWIARRDVEKCHECQRKGLPSKEAQLFLKIDKMHVPIYHCTDFVQQSDFAHSWCMWC